MIAISPPPNLKNNMGMIQGYETLPKDSGIDQLIFQVQEGFGIGLIPKPTLDGTSGVYFLRNAKRKNIVIY